jgi:Amt family ammonium transporter
MMGWVYPTVVHWVWGPSPWLTDEGYRDFAGSGVVHLVGGTTALTAAYWVGPRGTSRFENFRNKRDIPGHSIVLIALGTFFLFVGFLAFNGGSVQAVDTVLQTSTVAVAVVNTCLAMAAGALSTVFVSRRVARNKCVAAAYD